MIRDDRGQGLVSAIIGVTVVLLLLLLAAHTLLHLHRTTVVTAAAFDAARIVAGSQVGAGAESRAEEHARDVMGDLGAITFTWSYTVDSVRLHVIVRDTSPLFPSLGGAVPFDTIDREITVRRECFRDGVVCRAP